MVSRLLPAFLLLCLLSGPVSCGKPREVPYAQLGYKNNVFVDPESGEPFTGISRDYYKDGTLKAEFPCRKGYFHGTVREWHPNGKPLAETEFVNGERTGQNREWTEAGQLYRERVYDKDRIVSEKNYEAGK